MIENIKTRLGKFLYRINTWIRYNHVLLNKFHSFPTKILLEEIKVLVFNG